MHLRYVPTLLFAAPLSSSSIMAFSSAPPPPSNKVNNPLPDRVDYLVVGGGATSMAFCDTLLRHCGSGSGDGGASGGAVAGGGGGGPSVVVVDDHSRPGGQWNDSYDFVRLHQPSDMYGVESFRLEPDDDAPSSAEAHRATRAEILDYYDGVRRSLEEEFDFRFAGETSFVYDGEGGQPDLLDEDDGGEDDGVAGNSHRLYELSGGRSIWARKVVDARYLQPDLPVHVPPKFQFDPDAIRCLPVNSLATATAAAATKEDDDGTKHNKHYVIVGAGKTGMDAIVFLLEQRNVEPDDIMWIVPNEAWITARENIGGCMEFLHECTSALEKEGDDVAIKSSEFFQRGFLEWEKQGRVYRFDEDILPTKFKDATLSKAELKLIKGVKRVVRSGRVKSIANDGTLSFDDDTTLSLPWSNDDVAGDTLFVHCSAGAFNYSKRTKKPPPVFSSHRISIQDVYGTPGFCFVGSVIGKLEGLGRGDDDDDDGLMMSDAEKNAMCLAPSPDATGATLPLGPSGGDVGVISPDHGYVQRLRNLRQWLQVPEIRDWLVGNRLFNLRGRSVGDVDALVEETWNVLEGCGIVSGDEK